ncbi:cytochrome P450 4C1-like [Schistocerca cancellata]|uniref:cytochrome P450 4C1-like n=1 Tax=Schistocerca cancellata TaxID=274614 RepID=UPI0021199B8F|nr:cytochrome P450 4C1-like [Schistocerca cancellata]XP_049768632.1 cytochrome P450 4C1-like [Schistocerca cancellata]XP_049768633.1 cytochrome P450 4C1-like [Schistocerca cancellata]XP_049768634.1 cytochrome P450 4C1-like [Schistocerca cancellata]
MAWWWWLLVQLLVWCCAGVVAVLWWLWVTRPQVDIPGPPTWPIIGNVLDLLEHPVTIQKFRDFHRQYGDLTRFYVGSKLVIMVAHPDDVQHILVTSKMVERDPLTTNVMRVVVGDGLLTLNGSRWKTHRKLINPTFHSELLGNFLEAFHEGGLFLSARLASDSGGGAAPADVHAAALFAALRSFCTAGSGVDPDRLIPGGVSEREVSALLAYGMTLLQKMMVRPWMRSKSLVQLTPKGRATFKYLELLRKGVEEVIAIRSAAKEEGPAKTRRRLLETLVKPGGQTAVPVSEVRDELVTMVLTATDTTAVCTSYVLAMLALHPEWQDAARKELEEVFGEGGDYLRAGNLAELASLRVLDSIIKETLRLFPVVPVLPRMVTEDIWLSGGRVLVPKGAMLGVMPFLTHRLPQFFPDPLRFDPSRFLEGRVGEGHPCSYLPFGLGARNCVGSQYARLEMKVFLATVLRRLRLLPHSRREDLENAAVSVTLHSIQPIQVYCVPLQESGP